MFNFFPALLSIIPFFGIQQSNMPNIDIQQELPMVIVVPSYNNALWCENNLISILKQDYENFRVIYINDNSSDETDKHVSKILNQYDTKNRVQYIRNYTRKGSLSNYYHAIMSCHDDEIIVAVDGDDWLSSTQVLKKLNVIYLKYNVWLTHGTLIEYPQGNATWSEPIPKRIINRNKFRTYKCPSHLRTFYAWLFKKIKKSDLLYEGEFWKMTGDMAMMYPMIEMAGPRHFFIKDILYVYNMKNNINDNKVDPLLQRSYDHIIRKMKRYKPLNKK